MHTALGFSQIQKQILHFWAVIIRVVWWPQEGVWPQILDRRASSLRLLRAEEDKQIQPLSLVIPFATLCFWLFGLIPSNINPSVRAASYKDLPNHLFPSSTKEKELLRFKSLFHRKLSTQETSVRASIHEVDGDLSYPCQALYAKNRKGNLELPLPKACFPFPPTAQPHLPGDTRRCAVGPRWNLRGRPERIRGSPWPRGHRRGTTQSGTTSRRRSRSWASRARPGRWDCRSSPLRCRAGCGRPTKQRKALLQWQTSYRNVPKILLKKNLQEPFRLRTQSFSR